MSTITREFTKEQLIERCKEAIASLKPCVGIAETKSLACFEIALASLEAEPVAEVYQPPNVGICAALGVSVRMLKPLRAGEILYTAPPVPVSVPDAMANDIDSDDHPLLWSYNNGWNACRAAMLQGAELVTTAYKLPFEQWLSQQDEPIDVDCGCVTTEAFYHWLRVAYEVGNSPVIQDGWVACSERMPEGMTDVNISNGHDVGQGWWDGDTWQTQHDYYSVPGDVTHWMPMPKPPLK